MALRAFACSPLTSSIVSEGVCVCVCGWVCIHVWGWVGGGVVRVCLRVYVLAYVRAFVRACVRDVHSAIHDDAEAAEIFCIDVQRGIKPPVSAYTPYSHIAIVRTSQMSTGSVLEWHLQRQKRGSSLLKSSKTHQLSRRASK